MMRSQRPGPTLVIQTVERAHERLARDAGGGTRGWLRAGYARPQSESSYLLVAEGRAIGGSCVAAARVIQTIPTDVRAGDTERRKRSSCSIMKHHVAS